MRLRGAECLLVVFFAACGSGANNGPPSSSGGRFGTGGLPNGSGGQETGGSGGNGTGGGGTGSGGNGAVGTGSGGMIGMTGEGGANSTVPADGGVDQINGGTGGGGGTGVGGGAGWWDGAWTKRSKVTITDADLKEEQTDFQVPVQLDSTNFNYAATRAGGADLRFLDANGKVLNHQVDTWDAAGTSVIWLRLPKLTVGSTMVWLYYGNPTAETPADAQTAAVWPAPYAGVWHLSGDAKDATPHGFDGMNVVGGSFVAAKEGRGFMLNRAQKDHIQLKPDIKLVAEASACTFSAWINPNNIEDSVNGMVIMTLGKWFTNNHNSYADFNVNASGQMISHVDPGPSTTAGGYTRVNSDSGIIKANEWAWVTYVIDLAGSQERFYKNGALASTKNATFLAKSFINMVSSRTVIGTEEDNIDHWYTGMMDEIRLETGMRTASWIAAQYRSMTVAHFVKVDPAESKP